MKPLLSGASVERYGAAHSGIYLVFPYDITGARGHLFPHAEMLNRYPEALNYLITYEKQLRARESGKMDRDDWYGYVYPKNLTLHKLSKLTVPRLVDRLKAHIDEEGTYYLDNVDVGGVLLPDSQTLWYVGALLNSRVLDFVHRHIAAPFRGGFRSANRQFLDPLPIPPMDADPALSARIVSLAKELTRLRREFHAAHEAEFGARNALQAAFDDADREMDDLVGQAYRLTPEERAMIFA